MPEPPVDKLTLPASRDDFRLVVLELRHRRMLLPAYGFPRWPVPDYGVGAFQDLAKELLPSV